MAQVTHDDRLRTWAEAYLLSVIAEAIGVQKSIHDFSSSFAEMGVDSFRVLKIIKRLEEDFGPLPKTLLFENVNITDLAEFFATNHAQVISAKLGHAPRQPSPPAPAVAPAATKMTPSRVAASPRVAVPLLMPESQAFADPVLGPRLLQIFEQHKNEAGASRGARTIAPNLFIGRERRGFFNYARCKDTLLAYAYSGPDDHFQELVQELLSHSNARKLRLSLFADRVIGSVGSTRFSSTPFGALQRIVGLQQFSLEGGAMRRLRYQVSKFEKAGRTRAMEYRLGADAAVEREIARVIDQWCADKPMVNPLIHTVKDEILSRTLHPRHRLFLTYLDDVLQNVILISPLAAELGGYLMDLEFYSADMPLGGLEFGIVRVIEQLVSEGCATLSLGGTYGCRLESCPDADAGIDGVLDELHKQGIFNDDGNLQFKNKFRPENRTIYLCRPASDARPDNVVDIIMMIADPQGVQTPEDVQKVPADREAAIGEGGALPHGIDAAFDARVGALAAAGFNTQNLPREAIVFDLGTDSWAQQKMAAIDAQMSHLRGQLQFAANVDDSLRAIFPFAHVVLTTSGRTAEEVFYKAFPRKGRILQNLLFPSGLFHQIDNGFDPVELPCVDAMAPESGATFKGDLDWQAVRRAVEAEPGAVALVCVELSCNAAGGLPVSMQGLRELRAFLRQHAIPLVLDATRVLENAQALIEHDPGCAGQDFWHVAREMLSLADAVTCSLAKDFGIDRGGLVATSDSTLFKRLGAVAAERGVGMGTIDRKLVALALRDVKRIEGQVLRRMESARLIGDALREKGVAVGPSTGGHCVLIDVKRLSDFQRLAQPVASLLAWLYLSTGIRAGAHSVGMRKDSGIGGQVRLAVPLGLKAAEVEEIVRRLVEAFDQRRNIPDLVPEGRHVGDIHAAFALRATIRPAVGAASPAATMPAGPASPTLSDASGTSREAASPSQGYRVQDIAIVGMAGRYPKARNLEQMWSNLAQGLDCIDELPADRLARRQAYGPVQSYRGGFVDDIDRFDSLFFNISPRDAELMDPQERMFLEVAWEAMEDAGYSPETLTRERAPRNVGVFVGAVWAMYQMVGIDERQAGREVSPNSFLWSIANHVSYCLNLCGPSMAVDTACSSSLTALYLACEAIYKGECAAAVVGGVNLDLHRGKLDINRVGGALSKDGVCRSFGKGANGYVAGEGAGAILVKPLADALRDGDAIHGVIKGVAVNHGGRSSGYAVPNPKSQAEVIRAALRQAGVDARSLGYIEAHGTGTELGDPVEIRGLSSAFEPYDVALQSCAIGSIKTNIGHLEAAAGIVGICKVLLQMRHGQLAPSLHAQELNEFIDFEHSPFRVVQQLERWEPKDVDGIRVPLRAGVSSFGAGGSNAHVVLESHGPDVRVQAPLVEDLAFPLTARTEDQLREVAFRLKQHLRQPSFAAGAEVVHDLPAIAHTLQVGRKALEYRAVILARTTDDLVQGLGDFIDGSRSDQVLAGSARNAEPVSRLLSRKEHDDFIGVLAKGRDVRGLAQLWVDGMFSDWRGVATNAGVRKVHLPTYPFADRRHWAGGAVAAARESSGRVQALHPMLDSNESTFERQVFLKRFHDRDFFIHDHRVSQIPTLPGVAYLELARKAGEIATGRTVRRIRNIFWLSPIAVRDSAPREVLIELKPNGEVVHFEVHSTGDQGRKIVHAQGQLLYTPSGGGTGAAETIDMAAIRERCVRQIDGREAYPQFDAFGLGLGPTFQVLGEIHKREGEALGRLTLSASCRGDLASLVLHPSLLDGSLQAGAASQLDDKVMEMAVPYSIGEVEILHPLQPECWTHVTVVKDDKAGASRVSRAHVEIVDNDGRVLVRLRDTVGVPLTDVHKPQGTAAARDDRTELLFYTHEWLPAGLPGRQAAPAAGQATLLIGADALVCARYRERQAAAGVAADEVVSVEWGVRFEPCGPSSYRLDPADPAGFVQLLESLAARNLQVARACFASAAAPGEPAGLADSLERGVFALLFFCQALVGQGLQQKVRVLYAFGAAGSYAPPQHEAVNGFANALRLEHPKLSCQTVELRGPALAPDRLAEILFAEGHSLGDETVNTVRYDGHERAARRLKPVTLAAAVDGVSGPPVGLRERGVYLITGGVGGLGLLFAQFLARRCQARLVLTGRSELSAAQRSRIAEIEVLGAEVLYLRADVAQRDQLEQALIEARGRFGEIHGVIHGAGVLRDSYVRNKTQADMAAVFAPKVQGTVHLDELTRDDALDFFVLFSSMSAVGGNPGQCDYGFANHFMDSFALQRESLRAARERAGKTMSFDWSLWQDGGMKLDPQAEQLFRKATSIRPLATENGLRAFVQGLASEFSQVVVVEGLRDTLEQAWGLRAPEPAPRGDEKPVAAPAAAGVQAAAANELVAMLRRDLSQVAMALLNLQADDVRTDQILLDLGFDSIGLATFANKLNEKYALDLTPILFFDYPSIDEIAKHLAAERRDDLLQFLTPVTSASGAAPAAAVSAPIAAAAQPAAPSVGSAKGWDPRRLDQPAQAPVASLSLEHRFSSQPIAIVGMSGVMPQSEDLHAFWENLRDAKDLVTLVPPDRWSWEEHFGDPLKETDKTNSKWGGFMNEVDKFDPLFFGISPREAQMMDPQQRIFLQTVWEAVEDAGHKVSDLAGTRTGLFVGVATSDYVNLINRRQIDINAYTASGNSHAILANRVSFLLNLRGPSAPIDTACSSSLLALHRAIEAIHTDSCDMAIVGGVQVMLTPAAHVSFSMAGMLSSDGKCKTFDKSANGYVRGEGSGAILIKTLAKAQADGDHIYAVVRATAENHGGRVTTLTAPNATAQAELLVEAYGKARIDPTTVGYIECHGTGTSLGDPIEVQALGRAFSELYRQHGKPPALQPHCGLSSVKTNIGHLETAAGIAGILKALLSIRHRQIPANLHFDELNPYINLKGSPFYVAQQTTPWDAPRDAQGRELPRRAGVSSFGFGGANAHVVLEEYVEPPLASPAGVPRPQVIVLSAKNEDRLKAYAAKLLLHCERQPVEIARLAYTLQAGRDAYVQRLAFVAADADDLRAQLKLFIRTASASERLHLGRCKPDASSALSIDTLHAWVRDGELDRVAQAWVRGEAVDWTALHADGLPRRTPLPTYPFARERCWIPDAVAAPGGARPQLAVERLHPLVHRNTSTLQAQKFSSRLSGREFFLQDHVVETQRVLPGVAYMEIARAAGGLAAGREVRAIRGLTWLAPMIVGDDGVEFEVTLTSRRDEIEFAVRTSVPERTVTHCTGRLALADGPAATAVETIDLDLLRGRCSEEVLTGEALYGYFEESGLKLGPSFRVVQRIWANASESLALMKLPQHLAVDVGQYVLHPALMDSALHSAIGLMRSAGLNPPLSLPFSVGEVEVFGPVADVRYGYARWSSDERHEDSSRWKANFLLLDASGKVLVRIRDFVSKPLHKGAAMPRAAALPAPGSSAATAAVTATPPRQPELHTLVPVWRPLSPGQFAAVAVPADARIALLGGTAEQLDWVRASYPQAFRLDVHAQSGIEQIEAQLRGNAFDHLVWIAPDASTTPPAGDVGSLIERQQAGVLSVLRITKALLRANPAARELQWTLVTCGTKKVRPHDASQPAHASVAGYFGSLVKEYPHWRLRLVDVESLSSSTARDSLALPWDRQGKGLAHRRGEWLQQELAVARGLPLPAPACRQGGVYVVLGGAGGIGEAWSRHMIERYQARMVWIGRRACDEAIREKLEALSRLGPRPMYVQADATDLASLTRARDEILETFPVLHGVVHSALVLRDQGIAQMDESTFGASLSAKVDASVNLDAVFGGLDLDFLLFFSSILTFNSSPGQSNYAAGCAFKDAFAQSLRGRRRYPVKLMNWGYWGNVGVVADASYLHAMAQMGIGSIESHEGIAQLELLLGSTQGQLAVLKTVGPLAAASIGALDTLTFLPESGIAILPHVRQATPAGTPPEVMATLRAELPSPEQDALVAEILASTLGGMGVLANEGAAAEALSIPAPHHARWLKGSVHYLQGAGWLDDAGAFRRSPRSVDALWADWNGRRPGWIEARPHHEPQTLLLEHCLKGLPDILRGRRLATDVLFPRSSMHLVEGVYRGNPLADHFNGALAAALEACIERRLHDEPGRKLRILEIGAGTGGTTAALLPMLLRFGDAIAEYCYSDVSKAFLMHAAKQYQPGFPAMTTAIFDVCKPLAGQSIEAGRYDIVVAANVLHATPSIRETVRNAKAALRRQGVLLLNEISTWATFSHLTFGLLEGWWAHEDGHLRLAHGPGLSSEAWADVLAGEGFDPAWFPAEDTHSFGQQIVVSASDGVVRQRAVPVAVAPAAAKRVNVAVVDAHAYRAPVIQEPARKANKSMGREHLTRFVAEQLSLALQLDRSRIRDDEPFAEYGVDSIVGVNLVRAISEGLQIELETTSLFEFSTVDALAGHIHETWGAEIAARQGAKEEAPHGSNRRDAAAGFATAIPLESRFAVDAGRGDADRHAVAHEPSPLQRHDEPIAIIGMSGRFAGSESLDDFWQALRDGRELVEEVTRWKPEDCILSTPPAAGYCRHGSFIDSADRFDPAFFRISPAEALHMDPQQRLFLEESWKALEDAGYANKGLQERRCGVYVGCGNSKYDTLMGSDTPPQAFWGNSESVVPARIAYYLDLQGPAIAVNTACSSSLVTIHLACQGLRLRETEMALAGGVFLQPTAGFYQVANRAGMLSPTGKCFAFDSRADGFVPGEGVGVVVLKRLSDALRDGDHIHGVIAGNGVNQDGSSNGIIAPNAAAQERLEREVYDRFGIDPASLQVLEAHGTGTLLGDSVEFGAVTRAFRKYTAETGFCAIGTVKTNIGHAATAAGVAGVLKLLLALKHREIPPSLNFESANPGIDLAASPFYLNREALLWAAPEGRPRRAAISSFGFSGTNAHLVIEEAPVAARRAPTTPASMVVLSAHSGEQLRRQAVDLHAFLQRSPDVSINDLAFTLVVGRLHLGVRLACVARDAAELEQMLAAWLDTGSAAGVFCAPEGEEAPRERPSLRKFGNRCIAEFGQADAEEALDHLTTIADLYVQGYVLDYAALFPAGSGRVALPTYPFARERYWIEAPRARASRAAMLHPLLHANVSDLKRVAFSTTLAGDEPFLVEERGRSVLPVAALLEMARAAVERAAHWPAFELRQVAFDASVEMTDGVVLGTSLTSSADGTIAFEISANDGAAEVVHCRGHAHPIDQAATSAPAHDLGQLQVRLADGAAGSERLLALHLPAQARQAGMALHPALADMAVRAFSGTVATAAASDLRSSALDALRVWRDCPDEVWAWVRPSRGSAVDARGLVLDVDLLDDAGRVCAELRGLALEGQAVQASSSPVASAPGAGHAARTVTSADAFEHFLREAAGVELNLPASAVSVDFSYFDLGFTSLGVANLLRQAGERFGVAIAPSLAFEYPTIRSLGAYLEQSQAQGVPTIAELLAPAPAVRESLTIAAAQPVNGHSTSHVLEGAHASEGAVLDQIVWPHGTDRPSGYEKLTF